MNLIDDTITYPYHRGYSTNNIHSIFELVKSNMMYTSGLPSELGIVTRKEVIDGLDKLDCVVSADWIANDEGTCPFGWMGVATKKDGLEYQGSIIKRILKWAWQTQQIRLPNEFTSKLGNIVGKELNGENTLHFEFDPIANYKAGCFGDGESCFWTDRQRARMLIRNEGGCFVKFYSGDVIANNQGVARCWIIPIGQFLDTDEQVFLLSNFYSDSSSLNQFNMTRAVADTLGFSYKRVSVESELNVLYTNSNTGFLLSSDQSLLDNTKSLILSYDEDYDVSDERDPLLDYGDSEYSCQMCGDYVNEDDYVDEYDICQSCYDDNYTCCSQCGTSVRRDDAIELSDDDRVCSERCASRMGWIESDCGCGWIREYDSINCDNRIYCSDCAENELTYCNTCEKWRVGDCEECKEEDTDGKDDICTVTPDIQPVYQEILIGKISSTINPMSTGIFGIESYANWWIVIRKDASRPNRYWGYLPERHNDYEFFWTSDNLSNILSVFVPVIDRRS